MKKTYVKCVDCGTERFTCSRAERCGKCSAEFRYKVTREATKAKVEKFDYSNVGFAEPTHYGRQQLSFTHLACGTKQVWTLTNLEKRLAAEPTIAPCSHCGAKRRWANGTAAFKAKYGLSPEREKEFEGYQRRCRQLSDRNYREFKSIINPLNLPRGMRTYHLDHKLPIFEGFKQGLDPAFMARVENLQMLEAFANLTKGRFLPS